MDARLSFWTFSLALAGTALALAISGVLAVRGGDVEAHRRRMKGAVALVIAFVASYGVKLAVIGREALHTWEPFFVTVLRVHQGFISVMLTAGIWALVLSPKTLSADAPEREAARGRHRLAGRIAIASFAGALTMSAITYWGMWQRAG
ncbi:MAG: DUF420 domain-containing protein [Chrysiogenetes bacterium]|nr:DUF420 domain-containing protein [Chrysiogenetes bacterium]